MAITDLGQFGLILRKLRLDKGLSMRKFAEKVGISHPYVSQIERGLLPPPSEQVIEKMSEVLEVRAEVLKGYSEKTADLTYVQEVLRDPPNWLKDFLDDLHRENVSREQLEFESIKLLHQKAKAHQSTQLLEAITLHFTPIHSNRASCIYLYYTGERWTISDVDPRSLKGLKKRWEYMHESPIPDSRECSTKESRTNKPDRNGEME